jgi:transposase
MSKAKKRMIVNTESLIIGMDIGKYHHMVVALGPDGFFTKPVKITNDLNGYRGLLELITKWKKEYKTEKVMVGMESTGHYWEIPARWLIGEGIPVVQVSAVHTKRAKELEDNTPGKTDQKDARIIAGLIRYGKYCFCMLPEGVYAELRELTKIRQRLIGELTEKRNYLRRLLDTVFPEIFMLFKKSDSKTLLHLLSEYPLPDDVISAGVQKIKTTLQQKRKNLMAKRVHTLWCLARDTVGIGVGHNSYRVAIRTTVARILGLKEGLTEIGGDLTNLLSQIPEAPYILSLKGLGVVSAAIIIGETGGLSRYRYAEELLKLAGLNLYEISSGIHKGKVRISKRGRPFLRQGLFLVATVMVKKGMPFHEEYSRLRNRGMETIKALTAISRKVCRLVFALARDKRFFSQEAPDRKQQQKAA